MNCYDCICGNTPTWWTKLGRVLTLPRRLWWAHVTLPRLARKGVLGIGEDALLGEQVAMLKRLYPAKRLDQFVIDLAKNQITWREP